MIVDDILIEGFRCAMENESIVQLIVSSGFDRSGVIVRIDDESLDLAEFPECEPSTILFDSIADYYFVEC